MKEYLPTLQERQKWLRPQPNFEVGDLVLMADWNTPCGQWPKGLVNRHSQTVKDWCVKWSLEWKMESTLRCAKALFV